MGCPLHGLDLSTGLFASLADLGLGVVYGDWTYGAVAPAPSKELPTASVKTQSSQTTQVATTTSSVSPGADTDTPTFSLVAFPSETAPSTTPSDHPQFLNQFNIVILRLASIIVAGAAAG